MSPTRSSCHILGCWPPLGRRLRFPNPKFRLDRFKQWVQIAQNPTFTNLTPEQIFKRGYVCSKHFREEDYCFGFTNPKLKETAVPVLHLPPVSDTPIASKPDLQSIDLPENSLNAEITSVSSTIDLFKDGSDPQLVDDFDLVRNLSSFDAKLCNIYDFELPLIVPPRLPQLCKKNYNLHQTTSNNEDQTEPTSTPVELEERVADENLDEIEVPLSTGLTEVNTDKTSLTEKPCFKSVKCYLPGSDTFAEVCRICFRSLIAENAIKLYGEEISMEDETRLKHMLKLVLPDMNLEIYPNTVICKKCVQLLESSYQLKEMWLSTQTKLQKILEKKENVINWEADLIILAEEGKNETSPGADHNYTETCTNSKQQSDEEQKLTDSTLSLLGESGNKSLSHQKKIRKKILDLGPHMCEKCGRILANSKTLRRHLMRHKIEKTKKPKEREIMCEICGGLFLTSGCLKQHSRTHTNADVELKCSFCGKEFNHIKRLKRHIYFVHTKRSFQCHLCGKQYPYAASLRSHLLIHDPSKKVHACNVCDKKFVVPSYLRTHQRMHATEHKWTCDYCGKSLKYEHSFRKHVKTYHMNEGEFVCEFCNKPYWKKIDLQRHRLRVHGCGSEVQKNVVVNETNDCTNVLDYEVEQEV